MSSSSSFSSFAKESSPPTIDPDRPATVQCYGFDLVSQTLWVGSVDPGRIRTPVFVGEQCSSIPIDAQNICVQRDPDNGITRVTLVSDPTAHVVTLAGRMSLLPGASGADHPSQNGGTKEAERGEEEKREEREGEERQQQKGDLVEFLVDVVPVLFDLETTGLDTNEARIIEIAALSATGKTVSSLVNPGVSIPEVIEKYTGINQFMVDQDGVSLAAAWGTVLANLNIRATDFVRFTAFNGYQFDMPMLIKNLRREDIPWSRCWNMGDPLDMFRKLSWRRPMLYKGLGYSAKALRLSPMSQVNIFRFLIDVQDVNLAHRCLQHDQAEETVLMELQSCVSVVCKHRDRVLTCGPLEEKDEKVKPLAELLQAHRALGDTLMMHAILDSIAVHSHLLGLRDPSNPAWRLDTRTVRTLKLYYALPAPDYRNIAGQDIVSYMNTLGLTISPFNMTRVRSNLQNHSNWRLSTKEDEGSFELANLLQGIGCPMSPNGDIPFGLASPSCDAAADGKSP